MRSLLSKIKKTKIWYFFLLFFFQPLFNFVWKNIINFKGRLIYLKFKKINKIENNSDYLGKNKYKKIIRNSKNFKNLANKINQNLDDEFLKKMREKISLKTYDKNHYLSDKPNFAIDLYPYLDEHLKKEIIHSALNTEIIDEVSTYLGVMPVFGKINLGLNIPVKGSSERGSMLWHKVDFGFKTVDFFIPIREVNKYNGPLHFHKRNNPLGAFHKFVNIIKNPKRGERNKIKIDEFKKKVNNEMIESFTGMPGDALMLDSFSCYHRGGYCESSERIMLRICYHTPDSIDMVYKKNSNGVFRYCNLLKENDQNLSFEKKYILFYRPNIIYKLKIPEFLIFIYKLFHFKE